MIIDVFVCYKDVTLHDTCENLQEVVPLMEKLVQNDINYHGLTLGECVFGTALIGKRDKSFITHMQISFKRRKLCENVEVHATMPF